MGNAPQIPGAEHVVKCFGYWPTFHDAEVLSISLDRTGASVAIYVFERTSRVDSAGYYVTAKHAVVTLVLEGFPLDSEGIVATRIEYFNQQNADACCSRYRSEWIRAITQGHFGVNRTDMWRGHSRLYRAVATGRSDLVVSQGV